MDAPSQPTSKISEDVADVEGPSEPPGLESSSTDPEQCQLWRKLDLHLKGVKKDYACMQDASTPEEGWVRAYAAWVIFMTLMAESYSHPPPSSTCSDITGTLSEQLEQVEKLSDSDRTSFRSSLSDIQACSWRILRDWWEGAYEQPRISAIARNFVKTAGVSSPNLDHEVSLYHENLFCLFDEEFNPQSCETGPSKRNPGDRGRAFNHALAQKASHMYLSPTSLEDTTISNTGKTLERAYEVCPWLRSGDRARNQSQYPYYLWDRNKRQTVEVEGLRKQDIDIQYTCISHTWGRWKKPTDPVEVKGVEGWLVPENSIFEVKELPQILSEAQVSTQFLWFDLVCIPQDTTNKLYLTEVSRQSIIFQNASGCIAWMNTIDSWEKTKRVSRWLCTSYLYHGHKEDDYGLIDYLEQAYKEANDTIELMDESESLTPWFSSLWTLQEACLCPDIILCDKNWRVLSLGPFPSITLSQLTTLAAINTTPPLLKKNDRFPLGAHQLLKVKTLVFGHKSMVTRVGILSSGTQRECSGRRAEAIMSVMGVTSWHERHVEVKGHPPPDTNLVLNTYPLEFVKEAAEKIKSPFYMIFKPDFLDMPLEDVSGSMLPFGNHPIVEAPGTEQQWDRQTVDHPSLLQWEIRRNGNVKIPKAGVLGKPFLGLLKGVIACEKGTSKLFQGESVLRDVPEGQQRVAISLYKTGDLQCGLILQGARASYSDQLVWRSVGAWEAEEPDFPKSETVDFTVL